MKILTIADGALTLGMLMTMMVFMTLTGGLLLFLYRASRLRMQLMGLKARHLREIETVQKEIFREAIEEISRELHDDFSQRLSIIKLMMSALLPDLQGENHALLLEAKDITTKLIWDLRNLTRYLEMNSATVLHLPEVIQQELERIKRAGPLDTNLALEGVPRELDTKTNLFVYRIVQESLKNVVAHARASTCEVSLQYGDSRLLLGIRDDGIGFATTTLHSKGLGLKNIKQRSSLLNANLTIESAPNAGTAITIDIPYPRLTEKTSA